MRRRVTGRRFAAIWIAFFAIYVATIGLDAFGTSEFGGDEPHHLLTAESLIDDRNVDLLDEYRERAYDEFYPYTLEARGQLTKGFLNEPHGVGFPLLIAPAYALGGADGVQVFLAAIAALAVALSYALALRVVPDPFALGAAVAVGLSPPMLAHSTAVYPSITAGAVLAGSALLALRITDGVTRWNAFGCFALLGLLPWLNVQYLVPAAVIAVYAFRSVRVQGRRLLAIGAAEVLGFSIAFYASLNNGLYGGLTPYAASVPGEAPTDASFPVEYLERSYRAVALWIDQDYGLVRWAPVFVLAFVGLWLVVRERRAGLARVIPELRSEETAAALCASVAGAQLFMAIFLAPTIFGFWFPARFMVPAIPLMVPLIALGLRRVPQTGFALSSVGVVASAWLYVDLRWGDGSWITERPDAPFGPLVEVFPYFGDSAVAYVVAALVAAGVAAAFLVPESRWRKVLRRDRAAVGG